MRIGDWSSDVCSSDLTVNHLARKTTVPLLIVRDRPFRPYDRLLVATDFSPSARVALETCISFFPAASITLFHAYVVPFAAYLRRSEAARDSHTSGDIGTAPRRHTAPHYVSTTALALPHNKHPPPPPPPPP